MIYDVGRPFYFRPVSKVLITTFPFFNRAFTDRNQKNTGLAEYFRSICYPRERVPWGARLIERLMTVAVALETKIEKCVPLPNRAL